jgi:hypothetical protein
VQQMEGPLREGCPRRSGGARGFDFQRHLTAFGKISIFSSIAYFPGRPQARSPAHPLGCCNGVRLLGESTRISRPRRPPAPRPCSR